MSVLTGFAEKKKNKKRLLFFCFCTERQHLLFHLKWERFEKGREMEKSEKLCFETVSVVEDMLWAWIFDGVIDSEMIIKYNRSNNLTLQGAKSSSSTRL
jgi:hypothetical protein